MSPVRRALSFLKRALISFRANQGILLAGAIAYYTLLSIIPLFTLLIVALSHLINEQQLLNIVESNLSPIFGTQAKLITYQMELFLQNRQAVGWIGLVILIFFSSMAFTVLENAMSVIFFHRVNIHRRHFLVSAIIPYAYILVLGIGILLITIVSGALDLLHGEVVTLLFWTLELDRFTGSILYGFGIIGLTLLLASFYMVMPVGNICFRHALAGSFCVAILWEITRHLLVWYFSTLSMVNIIYGSLTTAVIALLFLEVAAIILLFGAQVIAEYERQDMDNAENPPPTLHT
ncbi:YihY family inner membrane protein [Thiothrix caldifontis]|jgi:Predicted membrane protein|uniref:YihY family inner membrane protein n=1 Tax=Thiothrix caldifontis TaxID=525918 RepID=A0A1H4EFT0_9GAMM|nr:YihY/virulence factor BrkB family protein [Thiothrix caldifontis]SEA83440.1 YihY family inner membrane protein [Thiothrix caldifontis]